jgi:hypothetical protein
MRLAHVAWLLALAAPLPVPAAPPPPSPPPLPPLLDGLGRYHRAITTGSPEAQRYFDQGMRLLFAFYLEEAQRSFAAASRLDPDCASCFWGVAMSLGPHINVPGMPDRTRDAHAAAVEAQRLAPRATPARTSSRRPAEPREVRALDRGVPGLRGRTPGERRGYLGILRLRPASPAPGGGVRCAEVSCRVGSYSASASP